MKTKPFPLALVWLRAIWYFNSPHSSLHLPSLCRQWVLPCNLPVVCICAWYAWVVPVPVPVLNKRFWSLFTTQYTKHDMERHEACRKAWRNLQLHFIREELILLLPTDPQALSPADIIEIYLQVTSNIYVELFFLKWKLLPSCWLLSENDYHIHTHTHILFWVRGMKEHII